MKVNTQKVGLIYIVLVLAAIGAVVRIIDLQFVHKPDTSLQVTTAKEREIPCTRGSILAADGRYLAFSIPEYKLCMDCTQAVDSIFYANIESLGDSLALLYGDRSGQEYSSFLSAQRAAGRRYTVINKNLVTYQQMKRAEQFPILKLGRRGGGLLEEKYDHREYPYDKLAFRTLGHIKANEVKDVGIEGSCDSILRGTNGVQPIRLTEHHEWIEDLDRERIEPVDGQDVQLTIDIDMQDISERALRRQLAKSDQIEAGTVILLETKTGEIKAMVNMHKDRNGNFGEEYNYAIGRKGEPGSVFKLATLTMLLDEGKIKLDDQMQALSSWKYAGRTFTDHYLSKYSTISVIRGFEISSNNVFRMLAARFYGDDPAYFIDHLNDKLRISRNYDFDIKGFAKAKIQHPKDTNRYWSPADLPQIAMGYTVELTPMHTVTYYNAIANGGVMVQPRLIKNYQKNGVILKEFPVIKVGRVCREETAKELHRAMRAVVTEKGATGYYIFKDCKVSVAGKTGTARVVRPNGRYEMNGYKQHQATFAGFFPYEDPKYTVICVIYSAPTHANFYGATWSGPVVREIAEEIYANSPDWMSPIDASGSLPEIREYSSARRNDVSDGVPSVIGMGLRDGVAYLEAGGYKVSFEGRGKIVSQSLPAGSRPVSKKIHLILSDGRAKPAAENDTIYNGEKTQ